MQGKLDCTKGSLLKQKNRIKNILLHQCSICASKGHVPIPEEMFNRKGQLIVSYLIVSCKLCWESAAL